jgi:hypothetical protein
MVVGAVCLCVEVRMNAAVIDDDGGSYEPVSDDSYSIDTGEHENEEKQDVRVPMSTFHVEFPGADRISSVPALASIPASVVADFFNQSSMLLRSRPHSGRRTVRDSPLILLDALFPGVLPGVTGTVCISAEDATGLADHTCAFRTVPRGSNLESHAAKQIGNLTDHGNIERRRTDGGLLFEAEENSETSSVAATAGSLSDVVSFKVPQPPPVARSLGDHGEMKISQDNGTAATARVKESAMPHQEAPSARQAEEFVVRYKVDLGKLPEFPSGGVTVLGDPRQRPCGRASTNEAMPDERFPERSFEVASDLLRLSECAVAGDGESVGLPVTQIICENEAVGVDRNGDGSSGFLSCVSELLPSPNILCGRGTSSNPGNLRFKELVRSYMDTYVTSTKGNKKAICQRIVDVLQSEGRIFISSDHTFVTYKAAIEKTSAAMRDEISSEAMRRTEHRRPQPAGWQSYSLSATVASCLPPPSQGRSWTLCLAPMHNERTDADFPSKRVRVERFKWGEGDSGLTQREAADGGTNGSPMAHCCPNQDPDADLDIESATAAFEASSAHPHLV